MDADGYLRYYVAQHGGAIPVFRGSRTHQDGGGIGTFSEAFGGG